jgi:hypothetical protein
MATNVARLKIGTAGLTDSSPYTVPSATQAIITNVVFSNKTANTRTVTMTAGGYSFCTGLQVPANGTVNFDTRTVLAAAETITVVADVASAVDYFVSGVTVA